MKGYEARLKNRRVGLACNEAGDYWLMTFKRLAGKDEEGRVITTRVPISGEAAQEIARMVFWIMRDRAEAELQQDFRR